MPDTALILSHYFPPMNGPATQHPTWFFRFLPLHGFETVAITSSIYSGESVDESSALPDAEILRVPLGRNGRRIAKLLADLEFHVQIRMGMWEHGFPWSWFAAREAARIIRQRNVRAIVSSSPSLPSHMAAYLVKLDHPDLLWIADFQDPFVGNPFRRTKPMFKGLELGMEQRFFGAADFLSANTTNVAAMWRERYPQYSDKIVVTWGGFDPQEAIAPRPIPGGRRAPVLSHVGAIYGGRLSNPFLQSLARLQSDNRLSPSDLTVEFFGPLDLATLQDKQGFDRLCEIGMLQLKTDYVARRDALRVSEEADYLLVLDVTHPHNTKFQVPSKLFDYIRIGRPIFAITPAGSPTEYILVNSGIAHVVVDTLASPEEYDAGILKLLELPREPRPASEWFSSTFDARNLAGGIAKLIQKGTRSTNGQPESGSETLRKRPEDSRGANS